MNFGVWWLVVGAVTICRGDKWQWPEPEQAASVRIDTKVRFLDQDDHTNERHSGRLVADEVFQAAAETDGFYNRGGSGGRYPVRVETTLHEQNHNRALYAQHPKMFGESDGTVDSVVTCKCVSNPDCSPRHDSSRSCGAGKYLCCYKVPHKIQNTEYFNEIEDERPSLLPGQENGARPFPPAPGYNRDHGVLVGPGGPTGHLGPNPSGGQNLLVRPDGLTENVGPVSNSPGILVGPGGPTGDIGPQSGDVRVPTRNPDLLIGPEGPTGVIGPVPGNHGPRDIGQSESAQRGVLVGPGGPTGIIGPRGYGQRRPLLVGPGGPTGIIGPRMQGFFNEYLNRQRRPGLLVGPGGPTGIIGPGRQLLVGPGGPTGYIGPQRYFV